jgi:hypothetical protein
MNEFLRRTAHVRARSRRDAGRSRPSLDVAVTLDTRGRDPVRRIPFRAAEIGRGPPESGACAPTFDSLSPRGTWSAWPEPNRPNRPQRRLVEFAPWAASSGGLWFGSAEAPRPKPRELAAISARSRTLGAQSPHPRTEWRCGQSGANPSLRPKSLFGREDTGKSWSGPLAGSQPSVRAQPSRLNIRPISLSSETGNFCRRLGASASPAPALESRSFPPLAWSEFRLSRPARR